MYSCWSLFVPGDQHALRGEPSWTLLKFRRIVATAAPFLEIAQTNSQYALHFYVNLAYYEEASAIDTHSIRLGFLSSPDLGPKHSPAVARMAKLSRPRHIAILRKLSHGDAALMSYGSPRSFRKVENLSSSKESQIDDQNTSDLMK